MILNKHPLTNCVECPLLKEPYVPAYIPKDGISLIVVGEAPGAQEAREGELFVGPSGAVLQYALKEAGASLPHVLKTNVVACRPPGNATPPQEAIACCRERLDFELALAPEANRLLLGKTAGAVITNDPDVKIKAEWIDNNLILHHPAFILRQPDRMSEYLIDIRKGVQGLGKNLRNDWLQELHFVTTVEELEKRLNAIPSQKVVFDLETDQLEWFERANHPANRIMMLGLAISESEALIVPSRFIYGDDDLGYFNATNPSFVDERTMLGNADGSKGPAILRAFFAREDITFIAHNGKYDVNWLWSVGIPCRCDVDTMLEYYTINEAGTYSLKQLASNFLGVGDYEGNLVQIYLDSRNDYYSKAPYKELGTYCGMDVCLTYRLEAIFFEILVRENLWQEPFTSLIMPIANALGYAERHGIFIDVPHLEFWRDQIENYVDSIEQLMSQLIQKKLASLSEEELDQLYDNYASKAVRKVRGYAKSVLQLIDGTKPFKATSSYMMAFACYDLYKLPTPKLWKQSPRSTGREAITHLVDKYPKLEEHEFLSTILLWRRSHKVLTSYIYNILDRVDIHGRIHPTFLVHGTEVGRLSARDPAVQTIPRPYADIFGAIVRSAFTAAPGNLLIDADYSQVELRVAAVLSGEPFLIDVYANDRDLHSEVAAAMFGNLFTKEQRALCKMFNFSFLYGGNEHSFAGDTGIPLTTAIDFVHRYQEAMPVLSDFRNVQFTKARQQGYVQNPFGRRRRFPLLTRDNIDEVRKAALHMPVASTANDLNLSAATALVAASVAVILLVHDSIISEVPAEEAERLSHVVQEMMVEAGRSRFPEIPWKVDVALKRRWAARPFEVPDELLVSIKEYLVKNDNMAEAQEPPYTLKQKHRGIHPQLDEWLEQEEVIQIWPLVIQGV